MTATRRPLNYSTTIDVTKSVGECQALLAGAGASAVAVTYDAGVATGLSFRLDTPHGRRDFSLPVNIDGVARLLTDAVDRGKITWKQAGGSRVLRTREHAARVAWRVVKDWLEAQTALIDAQMATLTEVMLPYLQVTEGTTLYRAYLDREAALALPAATST